MHLFSKVHQIRQIVAVSEDLFVINSASTRVTEAENRIFSLFGFDKPTVADYVVLNPRPSSSMGAQSPDPVGVALSDLHPPLDETVSAKREGALGVVGELLDCIHFLQNSQEVQEAAEGQEHALVEVDGMMSSWVSEHLNTKAVFEKILGRVKELEEGGAVEEASRNVKKVQFLLQVGKFLGRGSEGEKSKLGLFMHWK